MQETLPAQNAFGLAHLWASGDAFRIRWPIPGSLMSLVSWYLILAKAVDWPGACAAARHVRRLLGGKQSVPTASNLLRRGERCSPYANWPAQANCCNSDCEAASVQRLLSRFDPAEQMERALRQQLPSTQAAWRTA
jgi:biopolymer transport protein ExbB